MATTTSSVSAPTIYEEIKNGKVTADKKATENVTSETGKTTTTAKSQSEKTKEMFLKILVAEMQYQDPTNPTDNTEYVKEMASLSQVEALQNMQTSIEDVTTNTLPGKYVTITDEEGNTCEGQIEYVTTVDDEKKVSIDGKLYSVSDISAVYDETYYNNQTIANTFDVLFAKLPTVDNVTDDDKDTVSNVSKIYDNLTVEQKKLITSKNVEETLKALKKKLGIS